MSNSNDNGVEAFFALKREKREIFCKTTLKMTLLIKKKTFKQGKMPLFVSLSCIKNWLYLMGKQQYKMCGLREMYMYICALICEGI